MNKALSNKLKEIYWKCTKNRRQRNLVKVEIERIISLNEKLLLSYNHILEKYKFSTLPVKTQKHKMNIWFMWWQGEINMPDVIKINLMALKLNLNGHTLNFISEKNIQEYIILPKSILEKVEKKIISITHLSDLIRSSILSEYGGLWLDATIHVTKPIPSYSEFTYWTPKWRLNPNQKLKFKLWNGLWKVSDITELTITQCMGIWYSGKGNPLFQCLRDFWLEYWNIENEEPYYWTTEVFLIGCMYNNLDVIRKQIDGVESNNSKVFELDSYTNKRVDDLKLKELLLDTQYFYLRWKSEYREFDQLYNEKTLYGELKNNPYFLSQFN